MIKNRPPTRRQEALDEPKVIPQAMWLWSAFNDLNSQRLFGSAGPQPVGWQDIHAWASLNQVSAANCTWAASILPRMDRLYVTETYKRINKAREDANRKSNRKPPARRG